MKAIYFYIYFHLEDVNSSITYQNPPKKHILIMNYFDVTRYTKNGGVKIYTNFRNVFLGAVQWWKKVRELTRKIKNDFYCFIAWKGTSFSVEAMED